MADFTSDEIQAAVEQLVQATVVKPYDVLGTRRPDVTFEGIQQAVAGIFILYPLAPYYCISLGTKRVLEAVRGEQQLLLYLLDAVKSLNRVVLPVEDLSPLYNAQSALQALQGAVAAGAPADITKLPQYQRYASNVGVFLKTSGSSIKQGSHVVPTPQEARASIPPMMTQLLESHQALVTSITQLSNAMEDFGKVNLSSLVARGIVSNAAKLLAADTAKMAGMSADERLAAMRSTVLNLLAAKSAVTKFGSFSGPSVAYAVVGEGFPYSDGSHLATPAVLRSVLGAPYNVMTGSNDQLVVTLDGGASTSVRLPSSVFATLPGTVSEGTPLTDEGGTANGYIIGNGVHPTGMASLPIPHNDELRIQVTSVGGPNQVVVVPLTWSNDGPGVERRTAQQVCDDINEELSFEGINGVMAEPYFYPSIHFQGVMDIIPTTGSSARFELPLPTAGSLVGCVVGDQILVASGPNSGQWLVASITGTQLEAARVAGSPTAQTGVSLSIGPRLRAIRLRCTDAETVDQLWSVTVLGDTETARATALTLGLVPNARSTCSPLLVSDVVSAVNTQQQKVVADSTLIIDADISLTSDEINPFHAVMSKKRGVGVLALVPGGFTLSETTGLLAAGVSEGDTVILRGQGNTVWAVLEASDTALRAAGSGSATASSSATFEVGPTLTLSRWGTVKIVTGPNRGTYVIDTVGPSPLDLNFNLRTPIPHYRDDATGQPLVQDAWVGRERVMLSSRNQTTASSVAVSGSGTGLFWPSPPTARGSSPYVFIPKPSNGTPAAGDLLEYYGATYDRPSVTYAVEGADVVAGGLVLQVVPDVPCVPTTWTFDASPPPFAVLKHGHVVDFEDFSMDLDVWLAMPQQKAFFFQALNRVINPLLANTNPSAADVGAAVALLEALALDALIESLNGYEVPVVTEVDAILKTYRAQGADRAGDILLSGQFSLFFGLSQDETSYAGTMQAAMRDVARNDLAVRKVDRASATQARMLATVESPDYEFDQSDTEAGMKPDAPGDFEKTTGST